MGSAVRSVQGILLDLRYTDAYLDRSIAGADVDLEYALKFLYSYNGSIATFSSDRREIERLQQRALRMTP